jgi:two-component system, probable response regulator PhcQ
MNTASSNIASSDTTSINAALGATILLVDDEPNVIDGLRRALRHEPFEFLGATSGAAAREVLARRHVDVVISDEQMPVMSGSQLLSIVRREYPHTIRMILSGQSSLETAIRAINEGEVYRFFLKPCNPDDLAFTVHQALSHKRLEEQSRLLLQKYEQQSAVLARLEQDSPGITKLELDLHGAVLVDESDGEADVTDLLAAIEQAMKRRG